MKDEELRAGGPPEKYDNTMISTWCKCPRSFYWFMRRLQSNVSPPYFTWGRAFGAGLNAWHEEQGKGLSSADRLIIAEKAAEKEWEKDAPMESGNDT